MIPKKKQEACAPGQILRKPRENNLTGFMSMLGNQWVKGNFVCVGLDPVYNKIPAIVRKSFSSITDSIFQFNKAIVDATYSSVCAYKPNSAFYEAYGEAGIIALRLTVSHIHNAHPGIPVIMDAKRGDIDTTNDGYTAAIFDDIKADAVTLNPYLGKEALEPFLKRSDKGCFLLCRTSNTGSGRFQNLIIESTGDPLYLTVAKDIALNWNKSGNCGVVAGATYPDELAKIRYAVGDIPILIPGIGAQGGEIKATVAAGENSDNRGMIISASRGIIFASGGDDFAVRAGEEAKRMNEEIRQFLL